MSIPLDHLYNYLASCSRKHFCDDLKLYHFFPHGSKNLENLISVGEPKETLFESMIAPCMIMHDQEPLNYHAYSAAEFSKSYLENYQKWYDKDKLEVLHDWIINLHLRSAIRHVLTAWDRVLLCHSEKNSKELALYEQNGFVGVYWWSHAMIALDWYRYAQHVQQHKDIKKTFLIYNRAWSNTREYRLKFVDLLIDAGLENFCLTTINAIEPEVKLHYNQYEFINPSWKPVHHVESYFAPTVAQSSSSANFHLPDYEATEIEIILETLFDDSRWHLTEKSLRPIACAQPFIVASTPRSLEYLRSYGFKTFDACWDESYDLIDNAQDRLRAIVDLMKQISNWDPTTRQQKMSQAQIIADYNRKLFFNSDFHSVVLDEFIQNFTAATVIMKQNRSASILKESWRIRDQNGLSVTDSDLNRRRMIFKWVDTPL